MKIYFTATNSQLDIAIQQKIISTLESNGHTVYEYGSNSLSPDLLIYKGEDVLTKTYKQLNDYLVKSDVVIAETSNPSTGIGFEISRAIGLKKPVLALLVENSELKIPNRKSTYIKYTRYNEDNIEEILCDFIESAKAKITNRFILNIEPWHKRFLNWMVKNEDMKKAEVVRSAIEKMMKDDKEYQKQL